MKVRHWLFFAGIMCITSAPSAPLLFEQWGPVAGIHIGLGVLLISVAALMTPPSEEQSQ